MQIQRRTFLAMAAFCLSGIRAHAAEDIIGVWSSETANVQNNHLQLVFTPTEATFIVAQLIDRPIRNRRKRDQRHLDPTAGVAGAAADAARILDGRRRADP